MLPSPQWPYSCVSSTHLKFPCPTYATRAIKRLSFLLFTCSSAQQAFSFKLNHNDDNYDWIIIMYYYWNNCAFCHKNLLVKDCKFSGAENKVNHSCLTPRTTERWSNNNRPTGYFLIPTKRPRSTQKMIQKAGTSLVLSQIYLLNFSLPDNCNSAHPDTQEDIRCYILNVYTQQESKLVWALHSPIRRNLLFRNTDALQEKVVWCLTCWGQ